MAVLELTDAENLVTDLRTAMSRPQLSAEERWEDMASAYNAAVIEINRELHKCVGLARKGLTGEALQRVEAEHLLELATVLDAPEWEVWAQALQEIEVELNPPVDQAAAESLGQLFGPQQRLEALLRQHRRLALARAPLALRLETMRRMRAEQPHNALLADDVRQFERARLAELDEEIARAAAEKDRTALQTLHRELTRSKWLERPAPRLLERAQAFVREFQQREAARQVELASRRLHQAWLEKDVPEGKRLLALWHRWVPESGLSESSPPFVASADAREWLEGILAIEAAQGAFSEAIDAAEGLFGNLNWRRAWATHRAELDRAQRGLDAALVKLGDLGTDPPEERLAAYERVQRAIDLRQDEIRGIERTRRLLALVGSVAATVLVGFVIVFSATYFRSRQELAGHVASLGRLVETKELTGAAAYIESLAPPMRRQAPLADLIGRHEENVREEEGRRTRFRELHGALLADVERAERLSQVAELSGRIKELTELAAGEGEETLVAEANRAALERRRAIQETVDRDFAERFASIRDRIAGLDRGDVDELIGLDASLTELTREPGISPEMMTPAKALAQANKVTVSEWITDREDRRLLQEIRQTIGDLARYQEKLKLYVERFPQRSRSEEFRRVLELDPPAWAGVKPWNDLIAEVNRTNLDRLTPERAAPLAARVKGVLASHPEFPAAASAAPLVPYLEAVAARVDADGKTLQGKLGPVLDNPTINHLYMVLTTDGERYYSDKPPAEAGTGSWTFKAFKTVDLSGERELKHFRPEKVAAPGSGPDAWLSPQSKFAAGARRFVERGGDEQAWDREAVGLLRSVYASADMDPILKCQLFELILPVVQQGSAPAKRALKPFADHLARANFDKSVNFIAGEDAEAARARSLAEAWFKRLPDPAEALPAIEAELERMARLKLGPQLTWVGYLAKDEADRWTCVASGGSRDGELTLAYPGEGSLALTPVGRASGKEIRLDEPTSEWLQGRPVFLKSRDFTPAKEMARAEGR